MTGGVFYQNRIPVVKFIIGSRIIYRKKFRRGQDAEARAHYEERMTRLTQYDGFQGIVYDSEEDSDRPLTLADISADAWAALERGEMP